MLKFGVKKLFLIIFVCAGASFAFGQTSETPIDLQTILKKADEQTVVYQEEFKNLLAKETKTFEKYDKNGNVKKQNVVESTFVVYQSPRDKNLVSEFRNVTKVDDKPITDSEKRSEEFFAELRKNQSSANELAKIEKESLRYDKSLLISGLTLLQAPVLSENLRPYFDFQMLGTENIEGNEVYVIGYRQTKQSPFISINDSAGSSDKLKLDFKIDLPNSVKKSDVFLQGKLWIDAKTFQLWREERELTARTANPVTLMKTDFVYQPSEFGILVPKQISLVENNVKNSSKKNQTIAADTKATFDYSRFNRTDVDVKILDDNSQ